MEPIEYQTVILAAFLHDIGKLLQRGSFGSLNTEGKHPKVSGTFISAYHSLFSRFSDVALLKTLVEHHHEHPSFRPDLSVQDLPPGRAKTLAYLVSEADNLSSSEREGELKGYHDFKTTPLVSVFNRIELGIGEKTTLLRYHPRPLDFNSDTFSRDIFPADFSEYSPEEMNKLLTSFGQEFKWFSSSIKENDFECFFANLLRIIYKYTWCIPSNTQEETPDVSLYDHLKTTAAITAALYQYHMANDTLDEKHVKGEDSVEKFCFIAGDISGIQSYLYDIANVGVGGVAKRLRARSFYLSSLVNVICHRLLHSLTDTGLPVVCNIISSGGKFVILSPNLPQVKQNLRDIDANINGWLLREFQGDLTMLFALLRLSPRDFMEKQIGLKLLKLEDKLNREKVHKLYNQLAKQNIWDRKTFLWTEQAYPYGDCPSCHKMPAQADSSAPVDARFCLYCEQQRNIAEKLISVRYIAYSRQKLEGDNIFSFFDDQPYSMVLSSSEKEIPSGSYLVEALPETEPIYSFPCSVRPLANYVAISAEKGPPTIKTFSQLASAAEGGEFLGILKGDVDRFGMIFGMGLQEKASLSRIATLSRMLDLFFSGWMNHALEAEFVDSYTVYSGGDDFLLVGPWDKIINLARYIQVNFSHFVADNQNITLSSGIAVTKPSFPIASSSKLADHYLKEAKGDDGYGRSLSEVAGGYLEEAKRDGRDRLHLFSTTVPWGKFDEMEEWQQFLYTELKSDNISSALAYRLLSYSRQCRRWLETKETKNLLYLSHLAYDISRNIQDKEVRAKVEPLTDLSNSQTMSQLQLPITWALLKCRRRER